MTHKTHPTASTYLHIIRNSIAFLLQIVIISEDNDARCHEGNEHEFHITEKRRWDVHVNTATAGTRWHAVGERSVHYHTTKLLAVI
jgi:hypothetical protein